MSGEALDTVRRYLDHAEESRVLAEQARNANARRALLQVALNWESMAAQIMRVELITKGLR